MTFERNIALLLERFCAILVARFVLQEHSRYVPWLARSGVSMFHVRSAPPAIAWFDGYRNWTG
jgi:hypothetical protein